MHRSLKIRPLHLIDDEESAQSAALSHVPSQCLYASNLIITTFSILDSRLYRQHDDHSLVKDTHMNSCR
jgi:hypothetical protein